MRRFFTRFLFWIFLIILLLFASLFTLSTLFGEKISNIILTELNKEIKGEIRISGTEFSLIEKFPYASIKFKNLVAFSTSNFSRKDFSSNVDTAIIAQQVFIQFNLIQLIKKEYKLHKISVENARVNIYVDNAGEHNFMFYEDNPDKPKSAINFEIKSLQLNKVKTVFWDKKSELLFQGFFRSFSLSGDFGDSIYKLKSNSQFNCYKLSKGNEVYLSKRNIEYSTVLNVNNNNYLIEELHLIQDDIVFDIQGEFKQVGDKNYVDIQLDSKDASISRLLSFIPTKAQENISKYNLQGRISYSAHCEGNIDKTTLPSLTVHYAINDGLIHYKNNTVGVNSKGTFTAKELNKPESFYLVSDNTECQIKNSALKGYFSLRNFNSFILSANTKLNINSEDILNFVDPSFAYKWKGTVHGAAKLIGEMKSFSWETFDKYIVECDLNVQNGFFADKSNPDILFQQVNSKLAVKGAKIFIDTLDVLYQNTSLHASGVISNMPNYLSSKQGDLVFDCNLFADNIRTSRFVSSNKNKDKSTFSLPKRIVLKSKVRINSFFHEKMVVENIQSDVILQNNQLYLKGFSANGMQGKVSGDLKFSELPKQRFGIDGVLECSNISLPVVFNTFDNFDQKFIQESHLKGFVQGKLSFSFMMNKDFEIIDKSLAAVIDAEIDQGALINFEPALELSKFIELSELQNITFSKLKNSVVIKNDSIFIPYMTIQSNAFSISLSGIQSFDSNFDYSLELLLNELLSSKHKKNRTRKEDFGEIEDDGLGRTKLFLKIKGNPENFKVSWDKSRVKEVRKEKIDKEKRNLLQVLKDEFRKKDESVSEDEGDENRKSKDNNQPKATNDFEYDFGDL